MTLYQLLCIADKANQRQGLIRSCYDMEDILNPIIPASEMTGSSDEMTAWLIANEISRTYLPEASALSQLSRAYEAVRAISATALHVANAFMIESEKIKQEMEKHED